MKTITIFTIFCVTTFTVVTNSTTERLTSRRNQRFFFDQIFGDRYSHGCSGCPRPCLRDIAVRKGYCCGCARVSDNLPIDCPAFPACPHDGRQLCNNYDYMMNCCCP